MEIQADISLAEKLQKISECLLPILQGHLSELFESLADVLRRMEALSLQIQQNIVKEKQRIQKLEQVKGFLNGIVKSFYDSMKNSLAIPSQSLDEGLQILQQFADK